MAFDTIRPVRQAAISWPLASFDGSSAMFAHPGGRNFGFRSEIHLLNVTSCRFRWTPSNPMPSMQVGRAWRKQTSCSIVAVQLESDFANLMPATISNFEFIAPFEGQLHRLGLLAERYFTDDPNTCLIKLRQLAELTAKFSAGRLGLNVTETAGFSDILRGLRFECSLPREVGDLFHGLRLAGNQAAHDGKDSREDALRSLKLARQLSGWYVRTFYDAKLQLGPFIPPAPPVSADVGLGTQPEELRASLSYALSDAERARAEADQLRLRQQTTEEVAARDHDKLETLMSLVAEVERDKAALAGRLGELAMSPTASDARARSEAVDSAQLAAEKINLGLAARMAVSVRGISSPQCVLAFVGLETSQICHGPTKRPTKFWAVRSWAETCRDRQSAEPPEFYGGFGRSEIV
jgi:hypothetical protein